jgi:hypothetical protein
MADMIGRLFGLMLSLSIVAPFAIFLFVVLKKFDVDHDGVDDY